MQFIYPFIKLHFERVISLGANLMNFIETQKMANLCVICSSYAVDFCDKATLIDNSNQTVDLLKCRNCQHLFHNNVPSQLQINLMYAQQNPKVVGFDWTKSYLQESDKKISFKLAKTAISLKPVGSLEVGCGNGKLLSIMQNNDFPALGIEPGLRKDASYIFSSRTKLPNDFKFNLIVMQDVIEHIVNPKDFIHSYINLAEPHSFILLTFPAGDSLEAKFLGVTWDMIRPLGHIHYFSKKSFTVMAKALQCEIIYIRKFRQERFYRSLLRLLLFPLLFLLWRIKNGNLSNNPYSKKNIKKYLINFLSFGDQYEVLLNHTK